MKMSNKKPKKVTSTWTTCQICYDFVNNDKETLRRHLQEHTFSLERKKNQLNAVKTTSHDKECNPNKVQTEQNLQNDSSTKKFQPLKEVLLCPLCEEEIANTDQKEAIIIYKHLKQRHPLGMKHDILNLKEIEKDTKKINKCEYCDQIFDVTPLIQSHVQKFHPNVEQIEQLLGIKQTRRLCYPGTIVKEQEEKFSSSTEHMSCQPSETMPGSETNNNNFILPVPTMIRTGKGRKYSDAEVIATKTDMAQQCVLQNVGIEELALCTQPVFDAIMAHHKEVLTMHLDKSYCNGGDLLSVTQHVERMTLCGVGQNKFQNTLGQISPKKADFETANDSLESNS